MDEKSIRKVIAELATPLKAEVKKLYDYLKEEGLEYDIMDIIYAHGEVITHGEEQEMGYVSQPATADFEIPDHQEENLINAAMRYIKSQVEPEMGEVFSKEVITDVVYEVLSDNQEILLDRAAEEVESHKDWKI